jgi:hypothetical protein
METKTKANKFNYYRNHNLSLSSGTHEFTICFGDPNESDHIIVGADTTEDSAKVTCKRLNGILKNQIKKHTPKSVPMDFYKA